MVYILAPLVRSRKGHYAELFHSLIKNNKKNDDNESNSVRPKFKGGSPLAMEAKNMLKKAFLK